MDMSKLKKEFPSQAENRRQWILDTIRANQECVEEILYLARMKKWGLVWLNLQSLQKHDRDALLLPNGILTDEQRTGLGCDTEMESQEPELTSSA